MFTVRLRSPFRDAVTKPNLTMVLLDLPDEAGSSRAYLEAMEVLPSLEIGLEDMMRACTEAAESGVKVDPINFLATYLMRNNPRHSEDGAKRLAAHKTKAAEVAAQRKVDEEAAASEAAAQAQRTADAPFMEIPIGEGVNLTIIIDKALCRAFRPGEKRG